MQYRNMEISDYDDVMQLWRSCEGLNLKDADSVRGIASYLERNPGLSFVAVDENGIVGSLMAGHDGKRGYIQHLAVATPARRQGVAARLVELCLEALLAQGIVKSHVHVINSNQPGREFWSRRGWHHRAEIEMYSFINGDNPNA
jgi:ribosomal protein S18 acetylase RimI-like enzyme